MRKGYPWGSRWQVERLLDPADRVEYGHAPLLVFTQLSTKDTRRIGKLRIESDNGRDQRWLYATRWSDLQGPILTVWH